RSSSNCRAPCGPPAAARAGTSTRPVATRRSGPGSPGSSGGARPGSTSTTSASSCLRRRLRGQLSHELREVVVALERRLVTGALELHHLAVRQGLDQPL